MRRALIHIGWGLTALVILVVAVDPGTTFQVFDHDGVRYATQIADYGEEAEAVGQFLPSSKVFDDEELRKIGMNFKEQTRVENEGFYRYRTARYDELILEVKTLLARPREIPFPSDVRGGR